MRDRPIGIWILTILAGYQFVLAIGHFLQALGILPYVVGGNDYGNHTWLYAILWLLLIGAWGWVTWALYSLVTSSRYVRSISRRPCSSSGE